MDAHDRLIFAMIVSGFGIFTFCVCLPLIYRKIPMNRLYGFRIRESFVSDARWYDINAHGGRLAARWACVIIAIGLIGLIVPFHFFFPYVLIASGIMVISVFAPLIQIVRWARATRQT